MQSGSSSFSNVERSYLRNREVGGVLDVPWLLIQLREGRVHALVFTASFAVLLGSRLLG